ncbi:MAG: pyridoxamine 5'-phosphate oxidase family protein [Pseudomonadota bacterium]
MIGDNAAWDEFISAHRWAVLTTLRHTQPGAGHPNSSVVAYAREGDTLLVSTPGGTYKRAGVENDERVNLCVISNAEPFNFVAVEARAVVTRENLLADTQKVFANIADTGYREPADLPAWLESQARVILRLQPLRVYGVIR